MKNFKYDKQLIYSINLLNSISNKKPKKIIYDIDDNSEIKPDTDISTFKNFFNKIDYIEEFPINNTKNIYKIICYIDYPLKNPNKYPAIFEFIINYQLTNKILLYLYSVAYQFMYYLEDNDTKFNPLYTIYGHDISDLFYNGSSKLEIYNNYVVFNAECDS